MAFIGPWTFKHPLRILRSLAVHYHNTRRSHTSCESKVIWKVAITKTGLPRIQDMAMAQIVRQYLSFRIDSWFSHLCCSAVHTDSGFIWFGLGPPLPVLHTEHEPILCASADQPFCYSCSSSTPAMRVRHIFGSIFHQQTSIRLSKLKWNLFR